MSQDLRAKLAIKQGIDVSRSLDRDFRVKSLPQFCPWPDTKHQKSEDYVASKGVLGFKLRYSTSLHYTIAHLRRADGAQTAHSRMHWSTSNKTNNTGPHLIRPPTVHWLGLSE